MNTENRVCLDHKFLLTDIAKRIASGEEHIAIKEISSNVTNNRRFYELRNTKNDWDSVSVIAMALYRAAKNYMRQA